MEEGETAIMRMSSKPDRIEPDGDLGTYLVNRAWLLNKVLLDHLVWDVSLAQFGRDAGMPVTWVDESGLQQTTIITRTFLNAHTRIVRSLIADLSEYGAEGYAVLRNLLAEQSGAMGNGEAG